MMQEEILKELIEGFSRAKSKNPMFSLRAYAKYLNVQPSALSEIMNGKRSISTKMGSKMLSNLGFSEEEVTRMTQNTEKVSDLSMDHFKIISEWQYFAILSLAELSDFHIDPKWIAQRINITEKVASSSIKKLIDLGMLIEDKNGNYKASGLQFKTPTEVVSASLKNHTLSTLELSKESLLNDPLEKRDFSTVTMAISTKKIEKAKKMIASFRKKLSKELESGEKDEVYKLAIQLFPLSQKVGSDACH